MSTKKEKIKNTDTLVYALGGLGEVGKNMYCIEHEDEIIIIDSGVMFPEEELLGVDYVIPDYTHLVKNNKKKKTLVITHGHEDHIGGIPFLLQRVQIDNIYAPRFAKAQIHRKLEERKMHANIIEINAESKIKTEHFIIGFFNVIHSIPDAVGVLVNTPNGRVVSTGDFKFDLTPVGSNSDYQILSYFGEIGITLLLSDSTNAEVSGFSISEKEVAKEIGGIFRKAEGRIILATFASNVYRVQQIIDAAIADGRKIAIFGRSMENIVTIARKLGHIKAADKHFVKAHQLNKLPANKACIICTGSQGEPMAALSRIANGTHRQISVMPGDTVVFSSSPIPGNAQSVSHVVNQLTRRGANVLTNSPLNSLHTTGHASKEEQKLMLQLVKPEFFMPMHGEYKMLKTHQNTAIETGVKPENIFVCANGDVVGLRDGEAFATDVRFQADDIYVDGKDSSGLSTAVLKDRKILSDSGLVSVVVTIDSRQNKILTKPTIVSRGFVFIKDNQTLIKEAEKIVYDALNKRMTKRVTFGDIKNTIRGSLEPFLYKKTQRNPLVVPVILNRNEEVSNEKKA
ncbi:ribonuclease J1 [Erysipelothrix urinaevulpis]|uniref:ribonuclease J1 n=1 Tax=Erysipelothrix urinaevulpis TaxID=2683717 RepID=UPI0013584EBD|nr:ribonuclease J [Erysipelothrix urinaevulpis]